MIILFFAVLVGFAYYWVFKWDTKTVLDHHITTLRNEGMVVGERSLVGFNMTSTFRIQNFTDFLGYAKQEDKREVYLDKSERVLYFLQPSTEGIETVEFYYVGLPFDVGGLWTLTFSALIMMVFKVPEGIHRRLASVRQPSTYVINLIIASIGIVGIWMTVRTITLYVFQNLLEEGFVYNTNDIFMILGFIVAANLPFTLMKALSMGEENRKTEPEILKGLIEVLIQAIIVGVITFIPAYSQHSTLQGVGGAIGYVSILLSMIFVLLALIHARGRLIVQKEMHGNSKSGETELG